jgi:hypothetical protein
MPHIGLKCVVWNYDLGYDSSSDMITHFRWWTDEKIKTNPWDRPYYSEWFNYLENMSYIQNYLLPENESVHLIFNDDGSISSISDTIGRHEVITEKAEIAFVVCCLDIIIYRLENGLYHDK